MFDALGDNFLSSKDQFRFQVRSPCVMTKSSWFVGITVFSLLKIPLLVTPLNNPGYVTSAIEVL